MGESQEKDKSGVKVKGKKPIHLHLTTSKLCGLSGGQEGILSELFYILPTCCLFNGTVNKKQFIQPGLALSLSFCVF